MCESSNQTFVGQIKESCPHLPGVVPGDIRSGVQLCCGCTVEHQSLAFERLHGFTAVQFDVKDVIHCRKRRKDKHYGLPTGNDSLFAVPLTWSVYQVAARFVRDVIDAGLTVKEGNVEEGGASDCESLSAVPDDVPLVWTQAKVTVL